jgi:hypothetical protein
MKPALQVSKRCCDQNPTAQIPGAQLRRAMSRNRAAGPLPGIAATLAIISVLLVSMQVSIQHRTVLLPRNVINESPYGGSYVVPTSDLNDALNKANDMAIRATSPEYIPYQNKRKLAAELRKVSCGQHLSMQHRAQH